MTDSSPSAQQSKKEQCFALLAQGKLQADVARELGIHPGTVGSWVYFKRKAEEKAARPPTPPKPKTHHPRFKQGEKMIREGQTNSQIIAKLKVSSATVTGWRMYLNIPASKGRPSSSPSPMPSTAVEALAAIPVPQTSVKTDLFKLAIRHGTENLRKLLDEIERGLL